MTNILTASEAALASMRPSLYAPGAVGMAEVDRLVQSGLVEDFPKIRRAFPEPYGLNAFASSVYYRLPWLARIGRDLSRLNVVEIGCGRAFKALAWSRLFNSYHGIDINPDLTAFSSRIVKELRRDNMTFHTGNAAHAIRNPSSFGIRTSIDVLVVFGTLEHLLPSECRDVLSLCREVVEGGGMVLIGETPNRLIPHDSHSTHLQFFQTLPLEVALDYLSRSPRLADIVGQGKEALYRFGMSISYHEFELYMASKGQIPRIAADGWSHWVLFEQLPRNDEIALSRYFVDNQMNLPRTFSRHGIDVVFDATTTAPQPIVAPRLVEASASTLCTFYPDRRFFALDSVAITGGGFCSFNLPEDSRSLSVMLDVAASAGTVRLVDQAGRELFAAEVEELRNSCVPRYHGCAVLDLSALLPAQALSVQAEGADSLIVCRGVLAGP